MVKFYNYHKRYGYTLYHNIQLLHWSINRFTGTFGDRRNSYLNFVHGTLKPCEWDHTNVLVVNRDLLSINIDTLSISYGKKFRGIKVGDWSNGKDSGL